VQRAAGGFLDGSIVVWLAGVRDADLVAPSILAALGRQADPRRSAYEEVVEHVRGRELLILLDNFEQVLSAAPLAPQLLDAAAGVKLLVTSRARLGVSGEHELVLGPLAQAEAVELFAARARAANAAFQLSAGTFADVGAVCERLQGVPLALELAAAWMRLLAPRELLERLDQRLVYLTGGPRDAPERQRTLRATLDWSYDLLDPLGGELLERLSVFQGGFTLAAAQAVCALDGASEPQLLAALAILVDHSLVYRFEEALPRARFGMLEIVREYAAERLASGVLADAVAARHARYFLEFSERARAGLAGPEQPVWRARMEAEMANVRAALAWALPDNEPHLGLKLATVLAHRFWGVTGRYQEGARWLTLALSANPAGPERDRAEALVAAALMARGNPRSAYRSAEQALELARRLDDPRLLAHCLWVAAEMRAQLGYDDQLVDDRYDEAISLAQRVGDDEVTRWAKQGRGTLALALGHNELALQLLEEVLAEDRAAGDIGTIIMSTCSLTIANIRVGHVNQAIGCMRDLVDLAQQLGGAAGVPCLRTCGVALAHIGHAERAARVIAHAEMLREDNHMTLDRLDRRLLDEAVAAIKAKLYDNVFDSAWHRGRALTLAQTYNEVIKEIDDHSPP
jgi:predicted ATPase